jgi:hypothetical protein
MNSNIYKTGGHGKAQFSKKSHFLYDVPYGVDEIFLGIGTNKILLFINKQ